MTTSYITSAALASGSEVGGLQDSHLGLLFVFVDRHGSIPDQWLSAVIWKRSSSVHSADSRTRVVRPLTYSNFKDWCFAAVGPMS